MDDIHLKLFEKPQLRDPIFIEGLPGVGNVGKLAAEHLIDQLKAVKFAEIISKYFPPQVLVKDDGLIKLVSNEFYYVKRPDNSNDIIFLVGDYQGISPEGQYLLSDRVLSFISEFGVRRIFTLGGYGIGKMIEKPRVLGAATDLELVEEMKALGVVFSKGEPGSGIVGASGLLLGLGMNYGMRSVCLMGETSGYLADPRAAEAVLNVLVKVVEVKIDYEALRHKAQQIDQLTARIRDLETQQGAEPGSERREDLGYIG
ncbi:MAG: proteasome assembly chaperone family protein [Thermoplasmata archaeon]|uniref:Proteasome assembly chaperone family protein n=1 Tax=Candidatus Sysuiplasma superficiale TaxID=2823368 RepID=A0A8J7YNR5_9ARCH|nr:proteasome assembly chaperone family protein [Candidatus Sysuiplasma superficiale]MBX8643385.1 proteasome assembly chaperone family protein [Candidatus Sysuiplasma superficiale]